MIDWLWMRVDLAAAASLRAGVVVAFDANGEQEWQTEKWLEARGSHDGKMAVRRSLFAECNGVALPTSLEISGSPAKFMQGHNLFGTDDIQPLAQAVIARVLSMLGVFPTPAELQKIQSGHVQLLRVDINYSYSTGSRENCKGWLRAAEKGGYVAGRGYGVMNQGTVRWPANPSRYWSMKGYCKGQEIEAPKHRLPEALRDRGLEQWANDKLRLELQLNSRYLRTYQNDGPQNAIGGFALLANWKPDDPRKIFLAHFSKLSLSGQMTLTEDDALNLPTKLRAHYVAWKHGEDLRSYLPSRTFYRYRKALLPFGVDIAIPQHDPHSNVIPLVRIVEAVPASVPEFAQGTDLYYEPPRRVA